MSVSLWYPHPGPTRLRQSGMNHKENATPGEQTGHCLKEPDGFWTSNGLTVKASAGRGRQRPARCVRGSAAPRRERGRACSAALPREERFAYVFGSLIFLNKHFLCTEKAKKKKKIKGKIIGDVAGRQSFFLGGKQGGTVGTCEGCRSVPALSKVMEILTLSLQ